MNKTKSILNNNQVGNSKMALRITIVYVFFLSLPLISCVSGTSSTSPANSEDLLLDENWVMQSEVAGTGRVVQNRIANVSFPINGQIQELLVETGDQVVAGEVIVRLDPKVYEFRASKAESALAINQNNYDKVIAGTPEYILAEAEALIEAINNETVLFGTTNTLGLIAAEARLEFLRGQPLLEDVKLAEALVEQAQVDLELAEMQLSWTDLRAPFDGTISFIYRHCFESAQNGQQIIQLSDNSNPNVEVTLDEFQIVDLDIGDRATILFPAIPENELAGTIVSILYIETSGDANLFKVLVSLADTPEWMRIGMTADIIFPRE